MTAIVTTPAPARGTRHPGLLAALALAATLAVGACADATGPGPAPACGRTNPAAPNRSCAAATAPNVGLGYYHP